MMNEFGFEPVTGCAQCGFKKLEVPPAHHHIMSHFNEGTEYGLFLCPKCGHSGQPLEFESETHRAKFLKKVKMHRFRANSMDSLSLN